MPTYSARPVPVPEEVDARAAGEAVGELQLGRLRVAVDAWAARAGRRARGRRVDRPAPAGRAAGRAVASASSRARWLGLWRQPEVLGQGAQPAVGDLVAQQAAGQGDGVHRGRGQGWPAVPLTGGRAGTPGRSGRCGPRPRRPPELEQGGQHGLDASGPGPTIDSVMPVSTVMTGGMVRPGLTSVWNVPRHSPPRTWTAPISVMRSVAGRAAGGLQVDHAEGDLRPAGCPGRRDWLHRTECVEHVFDCQGSGGRQVGSPRCRAIAASDRSPVPLHRLRQPDPVRRDHHPSDPGVPPLLRRRRADRGGRGGPGRGRGGGRSAAGAGPPAPWSRWRHRLPTRRPDPWTPRSRSSRRRPRWPSRWPVGTPEPLTHPRRPPRCAPSCGSTVGCRPGPWPRSATSWTPTRRSGPVWPQRWTRPRPSVPPGSS